MWSLPRVCYPFATSFVPDQALALACQNLPLWRSKAISVDEDYATLHAKGIDNLGAQVAQDRHAQLTGTIDAVRGFKQAAGDC